MQPTIYAVGFGPGDVLHMTTQAVSVLENNAENATRIRIGMT